MSSVRALSVGHSAKKKKILFRLSVTSSSSSFNYQIAQSFGGKKVSMMMTRKTTLHVRCWQIDFRGAEVSFLYVTGMSKALTLDRFIFNYAIHFDSTTLDKRRGMARSTSPFHNFSSWQWTHERNQQVDDSQHVSARLCQYWSLHFAVRLWVFAVERNRKEILELGRSADPRNANRAEISIPRDVLRLSWSISCRVQRTWSDVSVLN